MKMPQKNSSVFICQQCGYKTSSFLGKCPQCQAWGSLVESVLESKINLKNDRVKEISKIIYLSQIEKAKYIRIDTGFEEFNRVLGGGIVTGSIVLISGDPGVGKSTLLTQLALHTQAKNKKKLFGDKNYSDSAINVFGSTLYVAGEESAQQIKLRVDRIKKDADLKILQEIDVDMICKVIEQEKPGLVIIDSIQTLETEDLSSPAGSIGQVRECAHRLQHCAKKLHIPIFLVGHITKEGTVAGPKTLEHLVDVVLSLEGDQTSNFRILRANKNRFGPTDEVGIFEMEESGMREVVNPSDIFLQEKVDAPGSVVVATLNGFRPILIEIQALVTKSFLPIPRRSGNGVDPNRLQLLTAVISKRLGIPLYDQDIFVNVTGGLKVTEPAADLGICMAIISSFKEKVVKNNTVFVGEVGLLGELREIRQLEKRVKEAKKLGFDKVIAPPKIHTLKEALNIGLEM